mmetsp:Transcript_1188/g.4649  ORF Transcript_1188/g.4649 Transcript_1188/m.4649 type:complete len:281 (+) Transcript_1188:2563-3405(+)
MPSSRRPSPPSSSSSSTSMSRHSKNLTVLSALAVTKPDPSGSRATPHTAPACASRIPDSCTPACVSTISSAPDFVPTTACLPPGAKAAQSPYPPSTDRRHAPSSGFQTLHPLCEHVSRVPSSGDRAKARMSARWPCASMVRILEGSSATAPSASWPISHSSKALLSRSTATTARMPGRLRCLGAHAKPRALALGRTTVASSSSSAAVSPSPGSASLSQAVSASSSPFLSLARSFSFSRRRLCLRLSRFAFSDAERTRQTSIARPTVCTPSRPPPALSNLT